MDKILPVDVYVPGCPPSPGAFLEGLNLLMNSVGTERRPLSHMIGPQEVFKTPPPSMRDRKRKQRQQATVLRSPDKV